MHAVVLTGYGDVEKLELREVDDPYAGARQIKVKVASASINPIDWKIRRGDLRGMLPLHLPTILGRDVSGTVVSVGPEVVEFQVGDRVMGLVEHGYAELVVAPVEAFAKLPPDVELERAAALPLVGLTGTQLIEEAVEVEGGQRVLVTGALGGVGRVAVFTAKKRGAQVVAGVRARQRDEARQLEVDEIVALDDPQEIKRMKPVDAIADTVNGKAVQAVLDKVRVGGVVGTVLGPPLGAKEQGLRVHPMLTHPDAQQLAALGEAMARGELVLPVDKRYRFSDAQTAQQVAEAGGVGKVLLLPDSLAAADAPASA